MRQWKVDPRMLCRQHLVAEHNEHHMFLGSMRKFISIDGYIKNNLIEPKSLLIRHDVLVQELLNRGYKHKTPLDFNLDDLGYLPSEQINYIMDADRSFQDLMNKCNLCRNRYRTMLIEQIDKEPEKESFYHGFLVKLNWGGK